MKGGGLGLRRCLGAALAAGLVLASPLRADFMLVHLPNAPVETASRQAAALTDLANHLGAAIPAVDLEAKIFRRAGDAQAFLDTEGERVVVLLSAPAFLLELPEDGGLEPFSRFVRSGEETSRSLLVTRTDGALDTLAALRGRALSIVEEAPSRSLDYLGAVVFEGQLDPMEWFAEVMPVVDDFAATAEVLYGSSDGALVSQANPLLQRHLEAGDLRVLFESPPLSLPVVSVRRGRLAADDLAALGAALDSFAREDAGRQALAVLGGDGFKALGPTEARALSRLPERARKRLEVALPTRAPVGDREAPYPAGETLPFLLSIELPDPPLDPDSLPTEPPPP